MRKAISILLALVICFSLACTVSATANSPAQGGTPVTVSGNVWYRGSSRAFSTTIKTQAGADAVVESVTVGNTELTADDYTATVAADGTLTLTLKASFLSKLAPGKYTVTVKIAGAAYTFELNIRESSVTSIDNPKTGDSSNMELWVPMMAASGLALAAVMFVYFKKSRKAN